MICQSLHLSTYRLIYSFHFKTFFPSYIVTAWLCFLIRWSIISFSPKSLSGQDFSLLSSFLPLWDTHLWTLFCIFEWELSSITDFVFLNYSRTLVWVQSLIDIFLVGICMYSLLLKGSSLASLLKGTLGRLSLKDMILPLWFPGYPLLTFVLSRSLILSRNTTSINSEEINRNMNGSFLIFHDFISAAAEGLHNDRVYADRRASCSAVKQEML